MICSKCGKDNPEGSWICGLCGEPLAAAAQSPEELAEPYSGVQPQLAPSAPAKREKGSGIFKVLVAAMIVVIVALPAWYFLTRGPDLSTPSGTVEAFMDAISDDDCEEMINLIAGGSIYAEASDTDECSAVMKMFDFKVKDFEVLDETIEDDSATVEFEATVEVGSQSMTDTSEVSLIKEGDDWKIASGF